MSCSAGLPATGRRSAVPHLTHSILSTIPVRNELLLASSAPQGTGEMTKRALPRPHRRPPRQIRPRLSPRRSLTALARQSSREHSDNRHASLPAPRFRFRLSLQRGGSGSGKSIKKSQRVVPCRDDGIARLPLLCNPSVRSAPSFGPDLIAPRAAASTTASSIASGNRSTRTPNNQKACTHGHEKA